LINSTANFFYLHNLLDTAYRKIFVIPVHDGKALSETSESLPKCRHSPFCYVPQKQTAIDRQIVKVLLRRYPREAVQKALATLSPIGHKMLMVKERRL